MKEKTDEVVDKGNKVVLSDGIGIWATGNISSALVKGGLLEIQNSGTIRYPMITWFDDEELDRLPRLCPRISLQFLFY
ncbi:MAG: hypothetical protein U5K71_13120 [Gracilimonas sp.]|nr:hypothetical protein [Gracilimonas sp.]